MARARRDDPGMAAITGARGADGPRPRRGAAPDRRGGQHLGALAGPVRATPATAWCSPGSPAARRDGEAAADAERIFRSIGARGPAADAAEIIEAISAAGAADAADPVARPVPAGPRWRARADDRVAVEEGPRPAQDPRRAPRPADDSRHLLRAALARRRPGAARQPAVGRAGDRPRRPRPRQAVSGRVLRPGRQGLDRARPRPHRARRRGVPRRRRRRLRGWRGRATRRAPARGWRRPRRCTAATSSRRTRTRTGPSGCARRPRRRTSRSPGRSPRPPPRTATPTARRATTSGSSSATRTTRAPTSGSSPRSSPRAATARRRRRYGFYAAKMEEIAVEAAPFPGRRCAGPAGSTGAHVAGRRLRLGADEVSAAPSLREFSSAASRSWHHENGGGSRPVGPSD